MRELERISALLGYRKRDRGAKFMEKIAKECMLNTRLFPSDKFRGLPSEFEYGMSVLDKHTVILDDSEDEEGMLSEEGGEKVVK